MAGKLSAWPSGLGAPLPTGRFVTGLTVPQRTVIVGTGSIPAQFDHDASAFELEYCPSLCSTSFQPAQESLSRGSKFRSEKHLTPWQPQRARSNLVLEHAEMLLHREGESPPRAKPTLAPFDGGRPVGEPPLSRHNLPDSDAGRLGNRLLACPRR
jgi:hypothetical protein